MDTDDLSTEAYNGIIIESERFDRVLGSAYSGKIKAELSGNLKKVRPDWDLNAPKVKEQWENGNESFFYPYE